MVEKKSQKVAQRTAEKIWQGKLQPCSALLLTLLVSLALHALGHSPCIMGQGPFAKLAIFHEIHQQVDCLQRTSASTSVCRFDPAAASRGSWGGSCLSAVAAA